MEPESYAMLMAGLGLLVFVAKRKNSTRFTVNGVRRRELWLLFVNFREFPFTVFGCRSRRAS